MCPLVEENPIDPVYCIGLYFYTIIGTVAQRSAASKQASFPLEDSQLLFTNKFLKIETARRTLCYCHNYRDPGIPTQWLFPHLPQPFSQLKIQFYLLSFGLQARLLEESALISIWSTFNASKQWYCVYDSLRHLIYF